MGPADPVLQPGLRPWPPGLRRLLGVLLGLGALAILAWLAPRRGVPDRLLAPGLGIDGDYLHQVEPRLAAARHRIWILMYVVRPDGGDGPIDGLLEALGRASARGVDVRVGLDRPRDDAKGEEAERNRDAATRLAAAGVRVRWDEGSRTSHGKILLIDGELVVGSHNWTRSALTLNREASIVTGDPAAVGQAEAFFRSWPGWDAAERPGPGEPGSAGASGIRQR